MNKARISIVIGILLLTLPAVPKLLPSPQSGSIENLAQVKTPAIVILEEAPSSNGTFYRLTLSESISIPDEIGIIVAASAAVLVYKAPPSHFENVEKRNRREWELILLRSGILKAISNANKIFSRPSQVLDTHSEGSNFLCAALEFLTILPRLVEPLFLLTGLQPRTPVISAFNIPQPRK